MTMRTEVAALAQMADDVINAPSIAVRNAALTQFWGQASYIDRLRNPKGATPPQATFTAAQRDRVVALIDQVTTHVFGNQTRKPRRTK